MTLRTHFAGRALAALGDPMLMLLGGAFALTTCLAILSGTLATGAAEIDDANPLDREIAELGWLKLESEEARRSSARGVELLRAARPFVLQLAPRPLNCGAATAQQTKAPAAVIAKQLERYPKRFLAAVGLERILLCRGLTEAGKAYPSMPNVQHTLILDVNVGGKFMERLLHHELFHFADFADDGKLKGDTAWARLNEKHVVYGFGGHLERGPGSADWSEQRTGFVTAYAMSAIEEDKAELYSFVMTDPRRVAARSAVDPVVQKKVAYLTRALAHFEAAPNLTRALERTRH
jgi:hypothetical protein